jgi:hypothetical protein
VDVLQLCRSVLEFTELIANFKIMLRKHFAPSAAT